MDRLPALLDAGGPPADEAAVATLAGLVGSHVYPRSLVARNGVLHFLARRGAGRCLGLVSRSANGVPGFVGAVEQVAAGDETLCLQLCPLEHANAVALRRALPFLTPRTLGPQRSIGCGDRLGLATPGHVRAVRGTGVAPILAQQSIRELGRTERTAEQVIDDATWGALQEGWWEGYGADADHLKTAADIDLCLRAGCTFFTIDPGDHVDNAADAGGAAALAAKVEGLPWEVLENSPHTLRRIYAGRPFDLGPGLELALDEEALLRAAAKYGRAIAHTVTLYRHLVQRAAGRPFELEVSVDETATPTTVGEHAFVASELRRLGVRWVSLAPRYGGRFEKGVDYIGDLGAFEAELKQHVAVARHLGPYKLSLHSGSDKFSIYPLISRHAGDLVHLKTAGTSYLEALRAIAGVEPDLFRAILAHARERYPEDRASYHVSAEVERLADPAALSDAELPTTLDDLHTRQALHVTFGSVLAARTPAGEYRFRGRLYAALEAHEEAHYAAIEAHFRRHLEAFATGR